MNEISNEENLKIRRKVISYIVAGVTCFIIFIVLFILL